MMGAAFLKAPSLVLDKDESEMLASAVVQVAEHYPNALIGDPKTLAWINLAMVAGSVYGPRVVSMTLLKKR